MGFPRIMYDIAPLVNPSFETGADGTTPPSGWTKTGAFTAEIDDLSANSPFIRGSGHGFKALRIDPGTGGTSLHQEVIWAPVINMGNIVKIGLVGVHRKGGGPDDATLPVVLQRYNGGATYGSSVSATVGAASAFTGWATPLILATDNGYDRVRVTFDAAAGSGTGEVLVDYMHLGRVLLFPTMEADALDVSTPFQRALNIGGGARESVRLGEPRTHVRLTIPRVTIATGVTDFDSELQNFIGFVRGHKRFAFWLDRDDHTNRGHHFSDCILTDVYDTSERAGPRGYATAIEFDAALEWVPQEA